MPGSILGIDNHLALAIDVAISSSYIPTAAACMPGPGPFMFWHKWSGGTIYHNISGPAGTIMSNINGPPRPLMAGPFMW